jgi:hypothetical protein
MSFVEVQNKFYNALCEGLGLSRQTFQIIQPSPPLIPGDNRFLWNYFNNIPPASLTQNYIASGGNQLFSNYSGLMSALRPAEPIDLAADIGEQTLSDFQTYVRTTFTPAPTANQYPDIFFNWALTNAPNVANIGAGDFATLVLDPIGAAQTALMPYQPTRGPRPAPGLAPDWALGYDQLVEQLRAAPAMSFTMSSATSSSTVTDTWSGGSNSGFFGLFGSGDSENKQTSDFAASNFSVQASFGHVLGFQTNAGLWYTSSAMGAAYSDHDSPPWRPDGVIQWDNTFGTNGNLQRVMTSLVVVDTMHLVVTAATSYNEDDKATINHQSSGGMWPIYNANNGNGMSTKHHVDDAGAITITSDSAPGVPIVIGGNVLPIGQFLGHSVAAFERQRSRALASH